MGSIESKMSSDAFGRFCGTRARLQRISDMRFATGWILRVDSGSVIVQVNESSNWGTGDEMFIQAYGVDECLSIGGQTIIVAGDLITVRISGNAKVSASSEKTRHLAGNMQCHLKLGWFQADTEVIDISDSGIGIKTTVPVQKGESAELTIRTHFGEVVANGVAKYSRKLPGPSEAFRIGFEFKTVDRLSEAKWRMALDSVSGRHTLGTSR